MQNISHVDQEENHEEAQNVNGGNANPASNSLVISNKEDRYSLKYGPEFKELLDARDQVMEHEFNFSFSLKGQNQPKEGEDILETKVYEKIKGKINHFLAEVIGNIVSAGFKNLCKNDLEENEAKEFASKNIMLNINSIYQQTIKAIMENQQLKEMGNVGNGDKLK